jgi:hypothetical protein
MTISLAHPHPKDFGIRAELLGRSRPVERRLYLYVEPELAKSTDSASFLGDDLRGLRREEERRHGPSLKSFQSLGRIIGKPG